MANRFILSAVALMALILLAIISLIKERKELSGHVLQSNEVVDAEDLVSVSESEKAEKVPANIAAFDDGSISQKTDPEWRLEQARKRKLQRLKSDMKSADGIRWSGAFSDLLKDYVKRDEAIEIALNYLNGTNPEKRFAAAEILLRVDYSKKEVVAQTLADLTLSKPEAIVDETIENRISSKAFRLISQYRLTSVLPKIKNLLVGDKYRYKLFGKLADMGEKSIIPEIQERAKKRPFQNHIEYYGLLNATEQTDFVKEQFESLDSKVGMKTASAWAMMRFGYDEPYRSYLKKSAQTAIESNARDLPSNYFERKQALIYLSSIESEDTKIFLEQALDSNNGEVVGIALTNLLLRYDSSKAKQKLIDALNDREGIIDMELKYRLASVINDPQVNAVHPIPSKETGDTITWRYRVHQKDWSIYNWVHNYTIDYWSEDPGSAQRHR